MPKTFASGCVLTGGMVMCLMSHVLADPSAKPTLTPAAARAMAVAGIRRFNVSMNAPWTGNDRFFAQERTDIDTAIQNGQKPDDLLKKYEPDANRFPNAPTVQFRYYYAAYKAATDINNQSPSIHQQAEIRLGNLYGLALHVDLPHTYNYARLRFLCALASDPFDNYALKDLGTRLLAKDPDDFAVKCALTGLLALSKYPADNATAVNYSVELVKQFPNNPRAFGELGYAYYVQWRRSHSRTDADKAVTAYQKYLELEPANSFYRPTAQSYIDEITQSQ